MQRQIRTTRSLGRPGQGGVLFSSPSINAREAPPRLNGYQDVFFSRPENKINNNAAVFGAVDCTTTCPRQLVETADQVVWGLRRESPSA